MSATKISAYACPSCEELYEDAGEAQECCEVYGQFAYRCDGCEKIYQWEDKALECCPDVGEWGQCECGHHQAKHIGDGLGPCWYYPCQCSVFTQAMVAPGKSGTTSQLAMEWRHGPKQP